MVKLKKNSKILLLLVAIISLFGFSMIFASDEPGKITISKSATKTYDDAGDDNLKKGRNAKVTLTVNGNPYTTSQTSMSKLDIILVLDNSGSMAWGSRGKNDTSTPSRIASLKSTANDFINTMLDKDGNVQIGLVTFSKDVNTSVSFRNYSKKNDLTTAINGMTANGGTNLQAGIEQAHGLLNGGRNDAKKMVIILTDGIPTYFTNKQVSDRSIKITCGDGDDDKASKRDTSGSYLCPDKTPSAAAEQELDDLKKDYSTADIYTITFGEEEEAASKLEKINPVEANENHTYKNEKALDANQLKKLFENISQSLKNVLATNSVVTDTIPSDFSLTDTAKKDLESKEVEVTENEDGTTTLKWNIGDISAKNELSLTYEVRAKEEYHGSMYTNTKAVLTAKASDDNPFYENKDLSLEFEEPSVEIPAITKDDHYKDNSSYKGYSGGTINGTSILNNDLNKHIERESKEDVSVTDKIVIVENKNNNVKRIADADNKYEIYKDSSLQGTLTINEDGTFTFNSSVDTIGEVSFDYYIESDITNPHETKDVESNTSTVTLLINERQKMSINGKKIWEDDNNNDGLRPESVNVNLYADNEVIRTIAVAKSSDWKYSFNDLYVYRVGHENEESEKIVYRVAETQSYNGYSSSVDGYNITNKHEIEKTEVSGTKTWDDNKNQDGKRPKKITVRLYANGEEIKSQEVKPDESGNWKYSFTGLNKYENGKEISYTVKEDKVENYNTKISGYDITNTHTPQTIDINGKKIWNDSNNQDGKRPSSVTIQLYADGEKVEGQTATISGEGNNWDYSFKNLPMYKAGEIGHEIKYSVQEVNVDSNYSVQYDKENKFNIINTHDNIKTEVSGTKTWDDNNNQDGKRPEKITVRLYANGNEKESQEVKPGSDGKWNYSFTGLDKYSEGKEITYTVKEDKVEEYTSTIDHYNITNKHQIEKTEVSGTKTWDDNNNQDGKRPESIKVNLLADGKVVDSKEVSAKDKWTYKFENLNVYKNGQKIKYTISEDSIESYTTKINDYNITNTHEVEKTEVSGTKTWDDNNNQDGKRPEKITVRLYANEKEVKSQEVKPDESGNWKYSFTGLNKYENGKEISYTVKEDKVDEYTSTIDHYNITNKHQIEKTEVSGTKTWNDNNNQDGKRPESITINLLANGKKVSSTTATAASNWKYSFTGLNKYENGKEISYTITEDPVENYNTKISGYDITNTHTPQTIDINGKKIWNDSNNQDGKRPSSVTIQLYADGEKVEGQTATISGEGNNWNYSFKNLPMYKAGEIGHEINYSVQEVNVDSNYNVQYDEKNKFNITNTHENEKITVSGTKTWDDYNNQDGIRPSSVTIQLYADGEKVEGKTATISGKGNNWDYSFTNLDKYSKGKEIAYTVKEDEVTGYTTKISGYDITNTHTPEKISIEGTKTWNDNENQDGIRPDSITIRLLANNEVKAERKVTADNNGDWKYSFDNLDKYNQGTEIKYTLEEISVDGYTSEITDFNITNTHTPETVSYILQKAWSDQDNNDAIRPEYIIVRLYADGCEKLSQKVTAESGWTYTFENLPKYNNGKLINYTFTEDVVKGYNSSITINDNSNSNQTIDNDQIADNNKNDSNKSENIKNVTITNKHENEKNNITITKEWNDSGNIYNKRPDSIKVTIVGKVNGQIIVQKDIEITKNMNWLYITKDLDKYYKGQEIKYEIIEDEVDGYTTTYDDYNIINTYIKPAIGETSGEITPPNTGVETSNNNSLIIMLLILVSSFRFVLLKD